MVQAKVDSTSIGVFTLNKIVADCIGVILLLVSTVFNALGTVHSNQLFS
jgi:hypothetical protein